MSVEEVAAAFASEVEKNEQHARQAVHVFYIGRTTSVKRERF